MNPEMFFDNFGLLADAPNGVQKLRELILQLAVQGKLVPQDPNDEPAAVLLKKIRVENERIIKEKNEKKFKSQKPVEGSDVPYELAKEWCWARLPEVVIPDKNSIKRGPFGSTIRKDFFVPEGYKVYEQKNAIYNDFELGSYYLDEKKFNELRDFEVTPNDIIISCSGTIGKLAIAPKNIERGIINQALLKLSLNNNAIINEYFSILFPAFLMNTTTLTDLKGTAIKNIVSVKILKQMPFPLPPLQEQHRIVAKVDQLMSLCDKLEARQQKKQEARLHLNSAALDKVLTAHEPDGFAHHWQRICDNFDLLYGAPETVGELRKAILQLAVRGKLVPQDANDEPAAVLLERIKAEKERLVKEKKIKVAKALLPIKGDEWPYELPKEWKLARLGELVESMTNGIYKPSKYYSDNGIACLRMYNIQRGKINYLNLKRMLLEDDEIERYSLVSGDLLVNRVNSRELVGKAGVINLFEESLIFESKNIRVRFIICEELPEYINILFQTHEVREVFEGDAKQTCGQASISQPQVAGIITPLPPLNEQKRIVAKVDQLMALCDELEAKLAQSQTDCEKLMEAVVHQLVAT